MTSSASSHLIKALRSDSEVKVPVLVDTVENGYIASRMAVAVCLMEGTPRVVSDDRRRQCTVALI